MTQAPPERTTDRSRWLVPIVVAVIAAVATIAAAVLPGLIFRDEEPRPGGPGVATEPGPGTVTGGPSPGETMTAARFQSMLYVSDGSNVDLPETNDTLVDLAINDGPLRTRNQATMAVVPQGRPESRATCLDGLGRSALAELAVPTLAKGIRLCLKTSAGRLAIVLVEDVTVAVGDETKLYSLNLSVRFLG